ncbi:MAG: phosphatidate cytidylyltransferase [Fidelibacterota bacterium]
MKSIITRILVGVLGIPAILYIIYLGGICFLSFLAVVTAISQYEFYKMFRETKQINAYYIHAIIFGFLWLFITYYAPQYFYHAVLIPTMVFLILNLRGGIYQSTEKFAITIAGYLYIPVLISTLIMLRELGNYTGISESESWKIVLALFVTVWINDTFAYIFGSLLGKNKLAPKISPKKSREGSFAGIVGALIASFIFYYTGILPGFFTIIHVLVFAVILGVFPQLGDLTESMFKRDTGVKDSGRILLGHGGVLDRFDAIFLTAPAVYLFIDVSLKLIN